MNCATIIIIAAIATPIAKSLLFHYFHNKLELYLFLWKHAADLTKKYMCEYKVYETDDFFEMMHRGLMAKCAVMRKYTFLSLFSIYDVTAFEQEYLEMINHWEMVYGKGTENDRK